MLRVQGAASRPSKTFRTTPALARRLTRKRLGLVRWHRPQVLQITLVSHQHDNDVLVRVIPQLLQPSRDVLVCPVLGDVVHEQGADRSSVVRRCDGAVSLLSRCTSVGRSTRVMVSVG